ncbi:MAG: hypothetical protein SFZ23_16330 [Planctomycetota bacterium]|nr:hypothetical protein [Planctomycetota bacterium]
MQGRMCVAALWLTGVAGFGIQDCSPAIAQAHGSQPPRESQSGTPKPKRATRPPAPTEKELVGRPAPPLTGAKWFTDETVAAFEEGQTYVVACNVLLDKDAQRRLSILRGVAAQYPNVHVVILQFSQPSPRPGKDGWLAELEEMFARRQARGGPVRVGAISDADAKWVWTSPNLPGSVFLINAKGLVAKIGTIEQLNTWTTLLVGEKPPAVRVGAVPPFPVGERRRGSLDKWSPGHVTFVTVRGRALSPAPSLRSPSTESSPPTMPIDHLEVLVRPAVGDLPPADDGKPDGEKQEPSRFGPTTTTLIDQTGGVLSTLGLSDEQLPWSFVVGPHGKVVWCGPSSGWDTDRFAETLRLFQTGIKGGPAPAIPDECWIDNRRPVFGKGRACIVVVCGSWHGMAEKGAEKINALARANARVDACVMLVGNNRRPMADVAISREVAAGWLKKNAITLPAAFDRDGLLIGQWVNSYGHISAPNAFVVDARGDLAWWGPVSEAGAAAAMIINGKEPKLPRGSSKDQSNLDQDP